MAPCCKSPTFQNWAHRVGPAYTGPGVEGATSLYFIMMEPSNYVKPDLLIKFYPMNWITHLSSRIDGLLVNYFSRVLGSVIMHGSGQPTKLPI